MALDHVAAQGHIGMTSGWVSVGHREEEKQVGKSKARETTVLGLLLPKSPTLTVLHPLANYLFPSVGWTGKHLPYITLTSLRRRPFPLLYDPSPQ